MIPEDNRVSDLLPDIHSECKGIFRYEPGYVLDQQLFQIVAVLDLLGLQFIRENATLVGPKWSRKNWTTSRGGNG